jgi:hypothetical protein
MLPCPLPHPFRFRRLYLSPRLPSFLSPLLGLQGGEGLTKTDLGVVSSSFTVTYGVSKFAGSVITGRKGRRGRREGGREGLKEGRTEGGKEGGTQ